METSNHIGVPDILLERYLADDLPAAERQRIETQLQASDALRHRLDELRHQRDAFLEVDPPEQFAHRLATRLAVDEAEAAAAPSRRRWWAWIVAPSAAAAATAAVTLMVVQTARYDAQPSALQEAAPTAATAPDADARLAAPGDLADSADEGGWREFAATEAPVGGARLESSPRRTARPAKKPGAPSTFAADMPQPEQEPAAQPTPSPVVAPPPAVAPAAGAAAPTEALFDAAASDMLKAGGGRPAGKRARAKPKSAAGRAGGGKGGGGKAGKSVDDIYDRPRASRSDRVLGKADIASAFKKNAGNLKVCIANAAKSGELAKGNHKLALAWVIQPDGSVRKGRLTGPDYVMGTSLPACFRKKINKWRFPPSAQATPVLGYPLSFNL